MHRWNEHTAACTAFLCGQRDGPLVREVSGQTGLQEGSCLLVMSLPGYRALGLQRNFSESKHYFQG